MPGRGSRVQHPGEVWMSAAAVLALSIEGRVGWQLFSSQLRRYLETSFVIWVRTRWRVHTGRTGRLRRRWRC